MGIYKKIGVLTLLFGILIPMPVFAQRGKGTLLQRFELKDQNDKAVPFSSNFAKKVTLVVLTNYCSVELAGVWSIPVYYRFHKNPHFRFAFIFSKTCLPGFIPNGFISSSLQNAVESLKLPYILVDWDNTVTQRLGGNDKYTQLYLLDGQGVIRWQYMLKNPMASTFVLEKNIKELLHVQR